ncbi:MAG: hypothetical protein M3Z41_00080 [Candidatus Eremiobacteraeota bacterium]|nr:hypothetical protein [Candidatus Eremiobacteraeota bacterium]
MKAPGISAALALAAVLAVGQSALGATATVASRTVIHSLMNQTIDSGTATVGQKLSMQVVAPYPNSDSATWAGATVNAHVVHVQHASQGRKAELGLVFDRVVLRNGASAALHANLISLEQKRGSNLGHAALTTLGGMVVGNIIGKWIGTNAGGAMGAVGGALYGLNKKENFSVAAGSKVALQLTEPLTVRRP